MSKYTYKSTGSKWLAGILTTVLVLAVVAVIGLIFYPELKTTFTETIPDNIEQIQGDINNSGNTENEDEIIIDESEESDETLEQVLPSAPEA